MTYKIKLYAEEFNVVLVKEEYANNGHMALQLYEEDGFPFATLTVNLKDSGSLPENQQYIDTNNCPFAPEFLEENGLGKFVGKYGYSGYCAYPLYELYI